MLLYISESWVVTGAMLKVLEGLHHQASRQIPEMKSDGEWEYPLLVAALEYVGLYPINEYIRRWQVTIAENVVCHTINELCVKAEQRPGKIWKMRWWDQDVVNEPEE